MTDDRGGTRAVLGDDELQLRLEQANPVRRIEPSPQRTRYELAVRDLIVSSAPGARVSRRRRRGVALVTAAVLLASGAIAAAVLTRSAPLEVTQAAALDPGTIPAELRPLPGSAPHLLATFTFEGRTWEAWGSDTRGGTDLVHVIDPGPGPRTVASGGCPPPDRTLRVCMVSYGRGEQTVVGRVAGGVASVATVALDGTATAATVKDGFFLSVTNGRGDAVATRVTASDAVGGTLASESVVILDRHGDVVHPSPPAGTITPGSRPPG